MDKDFYKQLASQLHNINYEDVTPEQRRKTKIRLLNFMYGYSPDDEIESVYNSMDKTLWERVSEKADERMNLESITKPSIMLSDPHNSDFIERMLQETKRIADEAGYTLETWSE